MNPSEDFPERDELDRRIERGLRRLTAPTVESITVRGLVAPAHAATRRWAGWRMAVAAAASITLAVGTLLSLQALRSAPSASPSSTADVVTRSTPPSSREPTAPWRAAEVDVGAWTDAAWPAVIPGRFGTLDSTAYEQDPGTTLGHQPAVEGPFVDRWFGGPAVTTYLSVADPRALAESTQLILRGRPLAFSRPYFNATGGEFWTNELVGVRDGISADQDLQRDVLFQVDEVLGTTLPGGFEPGLVQFTVTAGQVVVDVPRDVPYADLDLVVEAGRYLIREEPGADLRIGEEVVLFLRYGGWLGLDGDGYGVVRTLTPSHPLYYAFLVDGEGTANLSVEGARGDQWNPPLPELREIARGLAPRAGQLLPDARVHPARPTHDAAERPLPSPTPCPPLQAIDYWAGYPSLDTLLADSDLVVVGRLTTRAVEVAPAGDEAVVLLANDLLVEQSVAGDANAGDLLPVARQVARDPACALVIDGNEPLGIDRPYLLALRRDGDRFVIPEAPRALAEVRAGRLVSERWPDLNGLTVAEAVERLEPQVGDGLDRLKADLERAGATVDELGTFDDPMPFSGRMVRLCVNRQPIEVYVYGTPEERAADAALIDPYDPTQVGLAIVEWQGTVRFWQRDRIIVLYLGADDATEQLLTRILGQPFARSSGSDPPVPGASC